MIVAEAEVDLGDVVDEPRVGLEEALGARDLLREEAARSGVIRSARGAAKPAALTGDEGSLGNPSAPEAAR